MVPYQYTDMPGHRKHGGLGISMDTGKRRNNEKRPRSCRGRTHCPDDQTYGQ